MVGVSHNAKNLTEVSLVGGGEVEGIEAEVAVDVVALKIGKNRNVVASFVR